VRVSVISDDEIIVFLNKIYFEGFDFNNETKLERHFKRIFKSLIENYNIDVNNCYNVTVYSDSNYGFILKIIKNDDDYYSYFVDQIDMDIEVEKGEFLYEIDYIDLDIDILPYVKIYQNNYKLYLKIVDKIDAFKLGKIIEKSEVIYGYQAQKILQTSKEVKI